MPEEWDRISRLQRTCVECSKVLDPGDALFSALYLEENLFVRRDRCPECWEPQKGGGEFSFWRTVVPEPEDPARKKRRIDAMLDPQVLFDVFREMTDDPDPRKRRFRFVLALMLVRRKKLKFVSIAKRAMADGQQDCLVLKQKGRGARLSFDVVDVRLSEEEAVAAQQEVGQLLVMGGVGEASEIDSALAVQEAPTSDCADGSQDNAPRPEGGGAGSEDGGPPEAATHDDASEAHGKDDADRSGAQRAAADASGGRADSPEVNVADEGHEA